MAKCIILGENPQEIPPQKKIKLDKFLAGPASNPNLARVSTQADSYQYLELVTKGYWKGVDLIFVYNDPDNRSNGILCLGEWNDGIV